MDPVQEQLDAYNAADLERFVACFAPDVVLEDANGLRIGTGREAMRVHYRTLFANNPRIRADVRARRRVGDLVIDEEVVSGLTDPMAGCMRTTVTYRIHEGLIVHVRFSG